MKFKKGHKESLFAISLFLWQFSRQSFASESCLSDPKFISPPIILVAEENHNACTDVRQKISKLADSGKFIFGSELNPNGKESSGSIFPGKIQPNGVVLGDRIFGIEGSLYPLMISYFLAIHVSAPPPSEKRTQEMISAIANMIYNIKGSPLGMDFVKRIFVDLENSSEARTVSSVFFANYLPVLAKPEFGCDKIERSENNCTAITLNSALTLPEFSAMKENAKEAELENVYKKIHMKLVEEANANVPMIGAKLKGLSAPFDDANNVKTAEEIIALDKAKVVSGRVTSEVEYSRVAALRSFQMIGNIRSLICLAAEKKTLLVIMAGDTHTDHFAEIFPKMSKKLKINSVVSCKNALEKLPAELNSIRPVGSAPSDEADISIEADPFNAR